MTALLLAGCGGGGDSDAADSTVPEAAATTVAAVATDPAQSDGAATSDGPFAVIVECLRTHGLEVEEPSFGEGGPGGFPNGTPPEGGSLPDRPGGGSLPPGVSLPPGGSFPVDGSIPPGGPGPQGGGQPQDPTFLASILGLDASDPAVTPAIETCTDQAD